MPSSSGFHHSSLQAIDAHFHAAGLTRSQRSKLANGAAHAQPSCFQRVTPEEITFPATTPIRAPNGVEWLPALPSEASWLWAGFSTRRGGLSRAYCADDAPGELNLGFTDADDRETVLANRRLLAEAAAGDAATPLIPLRQFHSNRVVQAKAADATRTLPRKAAGVPSDRSSSQGWKAGVPSDRSSSQGWKADGQMTDEPGVLLAVQTADCIPVLVADRRQRAVAAFHAGWRGTVKRIVETGVGQMRMAFGSRPEDLVGAIGPGIGACCYAVGEEVLSAFESQFTYGRDLFCEVFSSDPVKTRYPMLFLTQRAPGHSATGPSLHVDLIEANRRQLLAAGLKADAIQVLGGCTQCHPELFFSHRASRGHAGRMMAVIGVRARQKKLRR